MGKAILDNQKNILWHNITIHNVTPNGLIQIEDDENNFILELKAKNFDILYNVMLSNRLWNIIDLDSKRKIKLDLRSIRSAYTQDITLK